MGKRVIVAGPQTQAGNVKRVLRLAEKAAVVADRYAVKMNNPQNRYRVHLADNKAYNTWYAGSRPPWSVAYQLSLNGIDGDIVLKSGKALPENGETKTLDFVALVLRAGMERDGAAQVTFRKPFKTIDRACVKWIKQKL